EPLREKPADPFLVGPSKLLPDLGPELDRRVVPDLGLAHGVHFQHLQQKACLACHESAQVKNQPHSMTAHDEVIRALQAVAANRKMVQEEAKRLQDAQARLAESEKRLAQAMDRFAAEQGQVEKPAKPDGLLLKPDGLLLKPTEQERRLTEMEKKLEALLRE